MEKLLTFIKMYWFALGIAGVVILGTAAFLQHQGLLSPMVFVGVMVAGFVIYQISNLGFGLKGIDRWNQ